MIDDDQLILITQHGMTVRMKVKDMRVIGRATQGVKMMNLAEGDLVTSVTRIEDADDDSSGGASDEEGAEEPGGEE